MKSRSSILFVLFTLLVVAGLGLNILLTHANPLQPAGTLITVDTPEDKVADDGLCSLREAIQSANSDTGIGGCAAGNGTDTIILSTAVYSLTITNPPLDPDDEYEDEDAAITGDLDITADLAIRGAGSSATIIDAQNLLDRIFHIDPAQAGVAVKIYDLSVQNGAAHEDDVQGGGGILSGGRLFLDRVSATQNQAQRGGGVRVTNSGSLEILDSVIRKNIASYQGGGVYGDAAITLENTQISLNEAPRGGGIFCDRACTFLDVTISQNKAEAGDGNGGGVYIDFASELVNVTIDHNRANNEGGGIYSEAEINLSNVTISENFSNNNGGAIFSDAPAFLTNVTLYGNNTLPGDWAILYSDLEGSLVLMNTIIASNTGDISDSQHNCFGDLDSYGYNISDDNTCDLTHDTDLHDTEPLVDSQLLNNGGETKTHALLANSPGLDAGYDDFCPATDQRNFPRPTDGNRDGSARCDIGAYESTPGGLLRIETADWPVEEDIGTITIAVTRSDGTFGAISVYYMTAETIAPNMANRDADYIHAFGQLTWADGDDGTKYIQVQVVNDQAREPDEIFDVILTDPGGGAAIVDAARKAHITILENDPEFPDATPVPEPERAIMPLVNDN